MQTTNLSATMRQFKQRLRQAPGVIDLASILVGVIIVGILGTGIAATTFALIPFSQDAAAEQALDSVRTAEGAAYVSGEPNRYLNMDDLVAGEWIQASGKVSVETDADGTCFAAMSLSATGNKYWADSSTSDIELYAEDTSASACTDLGTMASALEAGNGGEVSAKTLTFDGNQSTSGSTAVQSLATDETAPLTTNGFARSGYTFGSWNTAADGSGTSYADGANYTMGASNASLYAQWTWGSGNNQ